MGGGGAGAAGEQRGQWEEVAGACWALGDEMVDLSDEGLLRLGVLFGRGKLGGRRVRGGLTDQLRVELGQTRLASVIEDKHGINHGVRRQRAERDGELEQD